MHALACICQTALHVEFFAKESIRMGQKRLQNMNIASLFEEQKIRKDMESANNEGLFREELCRLIVFSDQFGFFVQLVHFPCK